MAEENKAQQMAADSLPAFTAADAMQPSNAQAAPPTEFPTFEPMAQPPEFQDTPELPSFSMQAEAPAVPEFAPLPNFAPAEGMPAQPLPELPSFAGQVAAPAVPEFEPLPSFAPVDNVPSLPQFSPEPAAAPNAAGLQPNDPPGFAAFASLAADETAAPVPMPSADAAMAFAIPSVTAFTATAEPPLVIDASFLETAAEAETYRQSMLDKSAEEEEKQAARGSVRAGVGKQLSEAQLAQKRRAKIIYMAICAVIILGVWAAGAIYWIKTQP